MNWFIPHAEERRTFQIRRKTQTPLPSVASIFIHTREQMMCNVRINCPHVNEGWGQEVRLAPRTRRGSSVALGRWVTLEGSFLSALLPRPGAVAHRNCLSILHSLTRSWGTALRKTAKPREENRAHVHNVTAGKTVPLWAGGWTWWPRSLWAALQGYPVSWEIAWFWHNWLTGLHTPQTFLPKLITINK